MAPATSILLPVYDGAAYLRPQLDSILAQGDGDFELLALDDGSHDDSAAILAEYARRDSRMRVLPSAGNAGQALRLRELLAAAAGEFIAIADQDDEWDAQRNARLRSAVGGHGFAFGVSQLIDAAGRPLGATLLQTLGLTPDPTARVRTLFRPLASAHAALVRRDWLDPAVFAHPLPFDWLMSALALNGPGIAYVPDAIVRHRIHGANQMNRAAPDTARPLGALRNRLAFLVRRPAQLRLWLMLDFLGRAPVAMRADYAALALACRGAWFGVPSLRLDDGGLRRRLVATLEPLAGSADDWREARAEIDLLTRSIAHPSKAAEALRRLRG